MDPLVGGLFMGGLSLISGLFGANDGQAAAAAYSNQLSISQTGITNRLKLRASGKAVKMTAEQLTENRDAAYRAMSREQAAFNEQMMGFALGKQSLIKERLLAQGMANSVERYGNSARRIKDVNIIGEYGRQNMMLSETAFSAQQQNIRNLDDLARQRFNTDRQTIANLDSQLEGLLPSMAQTTYQPPNNMGLKIGNALLGGISTGLSTASTIKSFG